ncbi:hypothetical protein NC661_13300 [Aquibacillus koreensis]|uniref:Uncharacterized protein n=1 Tax=Aquibacillus koreensis TaxID=279446 RepID=A0A9X4AIU6_9BACI|nr:hypothetical protein [Aquibacillus koreensis]
MNTHAELREKLLELNNQTTNFISELKQQLVTDVPSLSLLSYFTHSINLTGKEHEESFLIGGFHIKNLSPNTFKNIYICLKIDTENQYHFSGKFRNMSSSNNNEMPVTWIRFDNSNDEKEIWFKLADNKQLDPYESISFSDMQVTWGNDEAFTCSIVGFVYTEREVDGITSLNSINLSIN